jgi:hypothetical protein
MSKLADYVKSQGLEDTRIKVGRNVVWPERNGLEHLHALDTLQSAIESPEEIDGTVTITSKDSEVLMRVKNRKLEQALPKNRFTQTTLFNPKEQQKEVDAEQSKSPSRSKEWAIPSARYAPSKELRPLNYSVFNDFSRSATEITLQAKSEAIYNKLAEGYRGNDPKERDMTVIRNAYNLKIPEWEATRIVSHGSPEVQRMAADPKCPASNLSSYLVEVTRSYAERDRAKVQRTEQTSEVIRANYPQEASNYLDPKSAFRMAIARAARDIDITRENYNTARKNLDTVAKKTANSELGQWVAKQSVPVRSAGERHLEKAQTWLKSKMPEIVQPGNKQSLIARIRSIAKDPLSNDRDHNARMNVIGAYVKAGKLDALKQVFAENVKDVQQKVQSNLSQTWQQNMQDMPDHPLDRYAPQVIKAINENSQHLRASVEQGRLMLKDVGGKVLFQAGQWAKDAEPHIKRQVEAMPGRIQKAREMVAARTAAPQKVREVER